MYKISSKVCVLFWGFKISLPELSLPTSQTLRWLLQDGAEECIGHGFVTHRGGHQRFAASLRRLDRRLDVCIAVDLWSSGHHQTGRKLGKWPFFQGDVVVITFLYVFRNFVYFVDLFLMMIYNYNIYIYIHIMMGIIVILVETVLGSPPTSECLNPAELKEKQA